MVKYLFKVFIIIQIFLII